jgi:Methylamine utilisation protein MauE
MTTALNIWLALILFAAAGAKARQPALAATALSTYGLRDSRLRRLALWLLVILELGLAGGLVSHAIWAPTAAASLFSLFSLATIGALLAGRAGRPCACFGSRSRLSWWTPLVSGLLVLAALASGLGWLPDAPAGYARWLTIGLAVCAAGLVGLAVVVLALAREVGLLRLGIASRGALEIADEGPRLGVMQPWAAGLPWHASALLGLAIFSSEGCPLCQQLGPAIQHVAADPLLAVGSFDEAIDAEVWQAAAVPGSPYAVALDSDGVARAKGTFNSLPQLESIIATGRKRHQEVERVI